MTGQDTIFGKILRGEIPCEKVYEDEAYFAFRDINPQAPVHILVIPKEPIAKVADATESDRAMLGGLLLAANKIAAAEGLTESGYRLVINNGEGAGQTVFHLHVHILGGRGLKWPPG
jgi:histidine triad (HIT) family protein